MITIYHNSNFANDSIDETLTGTLNKVARIASNDLEYAFKISQNISGSWLENFDVIPFENVKCRSTSAGDILEKDDIFYMISMIGFTKIENPFKK